ncbi:peritrophin type-A domain protein 3-like protein [Leptotrombidium deliense]|uniref:Peritrophin type-A domain protein 3-like protein n=1 Tax=Leptotrombidium deliense TaxID=299467 RepID=A0A443S9K0_9ACAR|nr:peritrophin type-A domain protein 3-like protein [Leptotrombidium deliense]
MNLSKNLLTLCFAFLSIKFCLCENVNVANVGSQVANNDSIEFDFVNLPGYGIIDDYNSTLSGNFSCFERRYGYYADVLKECSMFHLCYPTRDSSSEDITYQRFTFICSENGLFDQQNLVCVENGTLSSPCVEAPQLYDLSNVKLVESLQHSSPEFFVDASEADKPVNGSIIETAETQEATETKSNNPGQQS